MKIVIAPDKFKDCLDAQSVVAAIEAGVLRAAPSAQIDRCPMADGGEGTVAALVGATGGRLVTRHVTGPLPDMKVDATFGLLDDGKTAVIEMAAASGLHLLKPADRNPLYTTTFGTGELLMAAVEMGAQHIILGIGGSATCDAGVGCAQACGLPIILDGGEPVSATEPLTAQDLDRIVLIKHGRGSPVERVRITVACDVTNPLFGPNGAAPVFGPQKGAMAEAVRQLDESLRHLATRLGKTDQANTPGAGAAGGLGFGMLAFFNATLRPGIDIVLDATHLRERLAGADLCITGEGRLDASSASGKVIAGVARMCSDLDVPCVALVGAIEGYTNGVAIPGLTASFSICDRPMSLSESMSRAPELLARLSENVITLGGRAFLPAT